MPPPEGFHIDWHDVGSLLAYFEDKEVPVRLTLADGRWCAQYGDGHGNSFNGSSLLEASRWLVQKHQTSETERRRAAEAKAKRAAAQ